MQMSARPGGCRRGYLDNTAVDLSTGARVAGDRRHRQMQREQRLGGCEVVLSVVQQRPPRQWVMRLLCAKSHVQPALSCRNMHGAEVESPNQGGTSHTSPGLPPPDFQGDRGIVNLRSGGSGTAAAKLENTRAIRMDVSYLPQNGLLSPFPPSAAPTTIDPPPPTSFSRQDMHRR